MKILLNFSVITKKLTQDYCFMLAMFTDIQQNCHSVLQFFVQHTLKSKEVWFKTGVRDNLRFIPIHQVYQKLGHSLCSALLGFHALTGCDPVSSPCEKDKKRPWDTMCQTTAHKKVLKLLGKAARRVEIVKSLFAALILLTRRPEAL